MLLNIKEIIIFINYILIKVGIYKLSSINL